jgi:dihydroneopterin aldolase
MGNSHNDEIAVEGLKLHAFLGTKEWEKMTQQEVLIDFRVWTDLSQQSRTDRLESKIEHLTWKNPLTN